MLCRAHEMMKKLQNPYNKEKNQTSDRPLMASECQVLGAQIPAAHREWCGNHWRKMGRLQKMWLLRVSFLAKKNVVQLFSLSFCIPLIMDTIKYPNPTFSHEFSLCLLHVWSCSAPLKTNESKANSCSPKSPGFGWDWSYFSCQELVECCEI